jgi:hypothetical protein
VYLLFIHFDGFSSCTLVCSDTAIWDTNPARTGGKPSRRLCF